VAYKFKPNQSVGRSFARCAQEQLEKATHELTDRVNHDPEEAIHAARKAIKRERALLRLARGAVPRSERARQNAALRDAARSLSGVRDADVMIQTLDGLADRFAGQMPESTFAAVRALLESELPSEPPRADQAAAQLAAIQTQIASWKLTDGGWSAIEDGVSRTYRRGRTAVRRAHAKPSFENLHESRKRAKDVWYQLRLLAPVCGPAVKGQADEAHELSDLLGDDHDLGVLRERIESHRDRLAIDVDALLALVAHRRDELQREAWHVADRLYAEKPKAFLSRMRRSWKAGRARARARSRQRPAELARATRVPA
jgi:CHAD domain-containing protein